MKTIKQWLELIPDQKTRASAIHQAEVLGLCSTLNVESKCFSDALKHAFAWGNSYEGYDFWDDIFQSHQFNQPAEKLELTNMTAQTLIGAKIINAGYNKLYLDNGTEIELSPEEIDHLNTCADDDYMGGFTPVVNQEHVTDTDEQMPFLKAVLDDENISDEFKNAISQEKF